jgi:hypothetical protein
VHFRAFPCISLHFRAFPCISVHFRAFPCTSVHFRAFPCISVHFLAFPCISLRSHTFPCVPNRFRITPLWIITSANTNKFQANRDTRSGLCAKSFMWPQHAPEALRTLRVH